MKQTQEKFEAMNLEYENLYNEEDDRREYNSVWYSQVIECSQTNFLRTVRLSASYAARS